jgi:hypothetical protein
MSVLFVSQVLAHISFKAFNIISFSIRAKCVHMRLKINLQYEFVDFFLDLLHICILSLAQTFISLIQFLEGK